MKLVPRALAAFLAVILVSGACFATPAVANPFEDMWNGIVSFFSGGARAAGDQNNRIADGDTTNEYQQAGEGAVADNSTATSGRVWTDKSVFTGDKTFTGNVGGGQGETVKIGDADFLVSYSALSSSTRISGQTKTPVDVVLIVDLSGSMTNGRSEMPGATNKSRIAVTVEAINSTIEKLMNANPNNRVAVVGYNNGATTLLDLDHYQKAGTQNYFELSTTAPNDSGRTTLTSHATNSNGQSTGKTATVNGGTNTQMGVYQGMNILASAPDTTVEIDGNTVRRVPSVILLSDGMSSVQSGSEQWWSPQGNSEIGSGSATKEYAGNAFTAMMTAAYMKQRINANYNADASAAYNATVYTIGVGVETMTNNTSTDSNMIRYQYAKDTSQVTLNPSVYLSANTDPANTIRGYWEDYAASSTSSVRINVGQYNGGDSYEDRYFTVQHPTTGADVTSLEYVNSYFTADEADQVADVFDQIFSDISVSTPTYPTQIQPGEDALSSGYLTYSDPIGDYMEVGELKEIIYNDQTFTQVTAKDIDGGKQYVFEGKLTSPVDGKEYELSNIIITTTEDASGNQTLTVQIPAALIPMRINDIELNADGTVKSNEPSNVYPMRILYTVRFKDEVLLKDKDGNVLKDANGKPRIDLSKVSTEYITKHSEKDKDGNPTSNVWFYSNQYNGKTPTASKQTAGDAYVEFTPAATNPFYFIQEDTPLYNADGSQVTDFKLDGTYKFETSYYEGTSIKTYEIERTGNQLAEETSPGIFEGVVQHEGKWYIAAGTPRLANLMALAENKGGQEANNTETADLAYYPTFQGETVETGHFQVFLGNNGRVTVEQPGELTVTKTAQVGAGFTGPSNLDELSFNFTLSLKDGNNSVTEKHRAQVYKGTTKVGDELWLADGDTFSLKNGETLHVYNLSAGITYTVAENESSMPAGFKKTNTTGESGEIEAGQTAAAAFTNTYTATPTTVDSDNFRYQKNFGNYWDNNPGISFEFRLVDAGNTLQGNIPNPLPGNDSDVQTDGGQRYVKVDVTDGDVDTFGSITFERAGTYTYTISERTPTQEALGVDYSNELYRVVVVVEDDGQGNLAVANNGVAMLKTKDWDGKDIDPATEIDSHIAVIENRFDLKEDVEGPLGDKVYVDEKGDTQLKASAFKFYVEPVQIFENDGTLVQGATQDDYPTLNLQKDEKGYYATNAIDGSIAFGMARFTEANVGYTYVYKVWEQEPTPAINGMNYDKNEYYVHVKVIKTQKENEDVVDAQFSWCTSAAFDAAEVPNLTGNRIKFTNTYTPADAELTLVGQKTLDGRAWGENETFGFALTPASNDEAYHTADGTAVSTKKAIEDDVVSITGHTDNSDGSTATATKPAQGATAEFSFGGMTFAHAGTYKFTVNENKGSLVGLKYDEHAATVTVVVKENGNGQLVATPTYSNVGAPSTSDAAIADKAAFTNYYTTSQTYAGVTFQKVMNGRDLRAQEFSFSISGHADDDEKDHVVSSTVKNQHNHSEGNPCTITALKGLVFTQADAGKTFTYTIDETDHKTDGTDTLSGVKYDTRTFTVTLSVSVNVAADGTSNLVVTPAWTSSDGSAITDGVPRFINSYTPGNATADASAKFKKELTGRDWHNGETYQFKLTPENGAPLPDAGQDGITINADNTATVTVDKAKKDGWGFGNITFTVANMDGATLNNGVKQKVFTYKVNEVVSPEDAANAANEGMTYSDEELTLRIVVADNGNGALAAQVTTPSGNTFTNEYATSVNYALNIAKTLTGHAQAEGQFKFYVRAKDDATARKLGFVNEDGQANLSNQQITQKMPGAADGVEAVMEWLKSGDITFTNEDSKMVYTFFVGESLPGGVNADNQTKDGYTYDTSERTVTIEVEDDTNGTLTVTTEVDGSEVATYTNKVAIDTIGKVSFGNSYAASGSLDLKGDKSIVASASEWAGDESDFEFKVEQVDAGKNVIETDPSVTIPSDRIVSAADGAFAINGITFTKPGDYHFKVSEVVPDANKVPGIQYNAAPIYLDVTVSENDSGNGNGKLDVSVTIDGKSFDATNETLSFVNTYTTTPDTFTPEVTKYVVGLDAVGHFTFELSTSDETTQKAIDNNVITGSGLTEANDYMVERHTGEGDEAFIADGKSKTVNFNEMTFTKAGTYIFHVNEANNAPNKSWTYDDHTYTLKIVVTDKESKLEAVATKEGVDQKEQSSEFTNKFGTSTTYSEQGGLQVTKTLNGRALEAGKFNFTITPKDADSQAKLDVLGDKKAENTSFSNGSALMGEPAVMEKLGGLAFDENDIDKTFTYTVAEVKPGDAETSMPGYDYDKNLTAEVKIEVKQADGKIYTITTVSKGGESKVYNSKDGAKPAVVSFVNSYSATGELDGAANLAGTKTLVDNKGNVVPLNGRAWDFTLSALDKDETTTGAIASGVVTLPEKTTVQSEAQGSFSFGNIKFKSTGAASVTYKFKVTETGELDGVDNDPDKERLVEVRVTDNGNGTLTAEVVGDVDLDFINQYGADADTQVEVKGTKTLALAEGVNNAPSIEKAYTFELTANNGAPLIAGDNYVAKPTNPNADGTGTVTFGNLKFMMADLAGVEYGTDGTRSKEFAYTVTETGSVPGIQNGAGDPNTVKIKLTDDGEGNLEAELLNEFAFTNTYAPAAVTNAPADVKKVLEGRTPGLQANEFTFEMKVVAHKGSPADGFELPGDTTAKNAADGAVTFGDITFTKPGTYTVSVNEVVPADKDKAPFMTYDGHVYSYDVVVFSNGSDKLQVRTENESGSKTFTNTYETPEDTKDVTKTEDPKTTINGQLVGVGDKLTYRINWVNDAVDAQGKAIAATVTITDTVPAGTTLVENGIHDGGIQDANGVITWTIDAELGQTGTVSFDVVVADTALSPVDKITNEATINVGGNDSKVTVDNDFPKKAVEAPEGGVKVGDELTYTIQWANTSKDAAKVVVTDKLSEGLTFVGASKPGKLDKKTNTVTWNLGEQQAGTSGEVTVKVRVNEKALTVNTDNQATIKVGNDTNVTTNTVPGPKPQSGNLTISKTVVVPEGLGLDVDKANQQDFTFTVELTDAQDDKLTGEYAYTGANGAKGGKLKSGDKITLKHDQSITIAGLPEGAKYAVTETALDGFTPTPKDGVLKDEVSTTGATAAFTNTYSAKETKLEGAKNLEVTKEISGRKWSKGDSFNFALTANMDDTATKAAVEAGNIALPSNANKITVSNDSKGHKAAFGDITFKQAGDFQFYITELGESHDGLTYDVTPQLVKVHVADNGDGALTATVTEGANPTITNVYKAGETPVDTSALALLTKSFMGKQWGDEKFSFEIEAQDGAPTPEKSKAEVTKDSPSVPVTGDIDSGMGADSANAANATKVIDFGKITFKAADMNDKDEKGNQIFKYRVWEKHPEGAIEAQDLKDYWVANGIAYDGHDATLIITVNDDGKGNLKMVDAKVERGNFSNLYEAASKDAMKVEVSKTLTGRDMAEDETFTFDAVAVDAATADRLGISADEKNPTEFTTPAAKDGKASATTIPLNNLSFTQEDVGAAYKFTVSEVNDGKNGVTYDDTVYTVKISVSQDSAGTLVVTTTVNDNKGSEPKVTIHKQGADSATVTLPYANTYEPGKTEFNTDPTDTCFLFTKSFMGKRWGDERFSFEIEAQDGAPAPENTKAEVTKDSTDAPTGKSVDPGMGAGGANPTKAFGFGKISFTAENMRDADGKRVPEKTFKYRVWENAGDIDGITYDKTEFLLEITVIDGGKGELKVASHQLKMVKGGKASAVTVANFSNLYEATAPEYGDAGNLQISKTLVGRDMAEDEAFSFAVKADDAASADRLGISDEMTVKTGSAKNGIASLVKVFGDKGIAFTQEDVGKEFGFTVTEVDGGKPGVAYDKTEYKVKISVSQDDAGKLVVTTTVTDNKGSEAKTYVYTEGQEDYQLPVLKFTNTYAPIPGTIGLGKGLKILEGRDLKEGEFEFELVDGNGNVVQTVSNGADGSFSFDDINYTAAGTHHYTVREVHGGEVIDDVTYDDTEYKVTVTVENQGGKLVVTNVSIDPESGVDGYEFVFKNVYTEPTPPGPGPDPDPDPKPDPDPDPDPDPKPDPDPDPEPEPKPDPDPDPDEPDNPDTPDNPDAPDTPDEPKPGKPENPDKDLPQTSDGSLPAAALGAMAVGGIALVGGGAVLIKKRRQR